MEIKYENWEIVRKIGTGSFGSVYEIERKDFGVYKAALKVISIPRYSEEITEIRNSGMSDNSIADYYSGMVEDIIREFALMNKLKGTTNIVSYEDHQIIPHEGEIGWDIYIRMELLTPLDTFVEAHPFSEGDVARLGMDICRALERCEKLNLIHRDIKPGNIFVSDQGDFKLGDFGIARTAERTGSNMSRKGTYNYMAPEVYNGMDYGQTVDLYSLGLVMFRLLNHNRTPFLPLYPEQIKFQDQEIALLKRINGTPLPYPNNQPGALGDIILKACSYQPEDRFQDATEFRRALEQWMDLTEAGVPVAISALTKKAEEAATGALPEEAETALSKEIEEGGTPEAGEKKRVLLFAVIAAAVVVALVLFFVLRKPSGEKPSTADVPETKEAPAAQSVLADYAGKSLTEAQAELDALGVSVVTEEADGVQEAGTILFQTPEAGTAFRAGDTLTVTVSKGNQIRLPKFYNKSIKALRAYMAEHAPDMEITVSKEAGYAEDALPGRILSIALKDAASSEAAALKKGDAVSKDASLLVTLCGVQIPKGLEGMNGKEAQEALSGLKLHVVSTYSNSVAYGCVIYAVAEDGTDVTPGQVLSKGTSVTVYLSAGPKPQETAPAYTPEPYYPQETLPAPPDEG